MEKNTSAWNPPTTMQGLLWRLQVVQRSDPGISDGYRQAIRKDPGAARIETACFVRFGEFTEASVLRLFAEVAQARKEALADCLALDTAAAADYLLDAQKTTASRRVIAGFAAGGSGNGVEPRDKWFLEQWEAHGTDTYHKPAKIHAKWESMPASERAAICPDSPNKVTKAAVEQAIKRLRTKRNNSKPTKSTKRASRKKKPT